jgi:hypothetical protein
MPEGRSSVEDLDVSERIKLQEMVVNRRFRSACPSQPSCTCGTTSHPEKFVKSQNNEDASTPRTANTKKWALIAVANMSVSHMNGIHHAPRMQFTKTLVYIPVLRLGREEKLKVCHHLQKSSPL